MKAKPLYFLHASILFVVLSVSLSAQSRAYAPSESISVFPWIQSEQDPLKLVDSIVIEDRVVESAIGIGGSYTEQYARYERLCEVASEELLKELTKHPNNAVKVYAYRCLRERNPSLAEAMKIGISDGVSKVWWISGCSVDRVPVSDLVNQP